MIFPLLILAAMSLLTACGDVTETYMKDRHVGGVDGHMVTGVPPALTYPSSNTESSSPSNSFVLPKFNPAKGTLISAKVSYQLLSVPDSDNYIEVSLRNRCGSASNCRKDLTVFSNFTYGIDIAEVIDSQFDPIDGKQFDAGVQGKTQIVTYSTASVPAGHIGMGHTVPTVRVTKFFKGLLVPFEGPGDLHILGHAASKTRLDLHCYQTDGAPPISDCSQNVTVFWGAPFRVTVAYTYKPRSDVGGGGGNVAPPGG